MKNAQKPDHISLNSLLNQLKEGRFVIPDFQRDFEWRPWDIRDLIRSIFLDYYIGSLLLWKGKSENFSMLSCEHVYGFGGSKNAPYNDIGKPEYIVLDGQQRLTALYYALFSPSINLPGRASRAAYYVQVDRFMAEEYDQAFNYDWISKKFAKILENEDLQFESHIFPLSKFTEGTYGLSNWLQHYETYWQKKLEVVLAANSSEEEIEIARKVAEDAADFGIVVKSLSDEYQISYIELDRDIGLDKVCDIFTQINSKGVQLDVFDLINALLKPKGVQLKSMWRKASDQLAFVESDKMNVYVLQVMSILRQAYCSSKYLYFLLPGQTKSIRDANGIRGEEVLISSTEQFESLWLNAVSALREAIRLLQHPQEYGVISAKYIPYVSILPAFAAMNAHAGSLAAENRLAAMKKVRQWYWASVFLNRYSGSVESTAARDFLDMRRWIEDPNSEPGLIKEFKSRFRLLDLRKEVKRGSSVYNGIFNLLVIQGAKDWVSGKVPKHGDLDDHHIVPQSWGREHLKGNEIQTILNRTPLSAETNRYVISDRLPNEYLPEWMKKNGASEVRTILESHFISPAAFDILLRKPFTPTDYDEFISERQRTFQDAIEDLLVKERLALPPNLKLLDVAIEGVELNLRSVISENIGDDWGCAPEHVKQKVEQRIQSEARTNAAFDLDQYSTAEGRLSYCDLRELQDIITSKALWPRFEVRFAQKVALDAKFGQLAKLRNGIRHSRDVDKVTEMEGQAALIWFGQVLPK